MEECGKKETKRGKNKHQTNISHPKPDPPPVLIGQMEGGIMGSGATGRVERDLLITHGVSFNLLGGADGWSRKI